MHTLKEYSQERNLLKTQVFLWASLHFLVLLAPYYLPDVHIICSLYAWLYKQLIDKITLYFV